MVIDRDHVVMAALALSAILALAGAVQLAGPRFVRRSYRCWEYPRGFHRLVGIVELIGSGFLLVAQTRIWGATIAALVLVVGIITLLSHGQYKWAVPGMVILATLVPAAFFAGAIL